MDAVDAGLEQRHHVGGREFGLARTRRSRAEKKCAQEGPGGPAHGADEDSRHVLKRQTRRSAGGLADSSACTAVKPRSRLIPKSPSPTAESRLGQLLPVFGEDLLQCVQPAQHVLRAHCHVQIPQRSAGVSTGSSHSDSNSSSACNRVIEQPAMSRLVM